MVDLGLKGSDMLIVAFGGLMSLGGWIALRCINDLTAHVRTCNELAVKAAKHRQWTEDSLYIIANALHVRLPGRSE